LRRGLHGTERRYLDRDQWPESRHRWLSGLIAESILFNNQRGFSHKRDQKLFGFTFNSITN
jgi:hypothetical protein